MDKMTQLYLRAKAINEQRAARLQDEITKDPAATLRLSRKLAAVIDNPEEYEILSADLRRQIAQLADMAITIFLEAHVDNYSAGREE